MPFLEGSVGSVSREVSLEDSEGSVDLEDSEGSVSRLEDSVGSGSVGSVGSLNEGSVAFVDSPEDSEGSVSSVDLVAYEIEDLEQLIGVLDPEAVLGIDKS